VKQPAPSRFAIPWRQRLLNAKATASSVGVKASVNRAQIGGADDSKSFPSKSKVTCIEYRHNSLLITALP